ncbi:MAG: helix-turn-helix domain-containing protein [Deltaproteobacteria bacterium]|nr:helix-turn-helix domain-containing protein [Deltaproteobacteria bacterium]
MTSTGTFSLEDLARLTSYTKRTIRYYVQLGLVDRPIGEGRGAHYTTDHLRELLDIRKLTSGGLSLEAVRLHLRQEKMGVRGGYARKPGSVQLQSRVFLAPGLDLLVSPDESALTPEDIRALVKGCLELSRRFTDPPGARAGAGRPVTEGQGADQMGAMADLPPLRESGEALAEGPPPEGGGPPPEGRAS